MPFLARSPDAPPKGELSGSDRVTLNGLSLSEPDAAGVKWRAGKIDGWSSPSGTGGVDQRAQDHGGWALRQFLTPRGVTVEGTCVSNSHVALHAAEDALIAACSLDLVPLVVEQAGLTRQALVRRDGPVLWQEITPGVAEWSVQLVAPDPRKYGPQREYTTGLPSSVGGLSVPPITVDTTNLVGNPSFESDASGWGVIGAGVTVARDTLRAESGVASGKVTWGTAGAYAQAVAYDVAGLTAGGVYTFSAFVFVPAGAPRVSLDVTGASGTAQSGASSTTGAWERLQVSFTASTSTATVRLICFDASTAGENAWLDAVQVEAGSAASAYTDSVRYTGGLSAPFTVDAVVTSGVVTVVNEGNFETPGRYVVRGPVPDPRITAVVDGQERTLAWALTLGAGDWLDVDLDRRTAYQNGTASRVGSMTSRQWWKHPPGKTEVAFNAATYSQGASLTAVVKSAWE